jgi:hypothetical protein
VSFRFVIINARFDREWRAVGVVGEGGVCLLCLVLAWCSLAGLFKTLPGGYALKLPSLHKRTYIAYAYVL